MCCSVGIMGGERGGRGMVELPEGVTWREDGTLCMTVETGQGAWTITCLVEAH